MPMRATAAEPIDFQTAALGYRPPRARLLALPDVPHPCRRTFVAAAGSQPMTDDPQTPPTFRAVMTPHRSLGPKGFVILMTLLCLVNFGVGLTFWMLGAWPIMGFCGLDVLLVYLAFRASYRSGRAYESIDLASGELTLTRVDAKGAAERFIFNPYWVRVALTEAVDGRTELSLTSHGRRLVFARFLSDDERREIAEALQGALAGHRG